MPVSRLLMDRELSQALDGVPMTSNGAFDLTDIPATRAAFRAQAESIAESELPTTRRSPRRSTASAGRTAPTCRSACCGPRPRRDRCR